METTEVEPRAASVETGFLRTWWSRPCGGREVFMIALPLTISTMSWTFMTFFDRMFLLWHSQEEMAAAAPSAFLLFSMIALPLGIATYANTFVAQYDGSGNPQRIGAAVWQAVFLGILLAPLFLFSVPIADAIFRFGGHPPAIQRYEHIYFRLLTWSAGATICAGGLTTFFTGRGQTKTVMMVDGLAAVINVVLDYLLIFGHFGFPEAGIAGAAFATTVAQWIKVAIYFWLFWRPQNETRFGVRSGMRVDFSLFRRMFYYGLPEGLRLFGELAMLTGFMVVLGRLGEKELAATTLAFNINGVGFMPLVGAGIAVSTLVGNQLGQNRADLAARATNSALALSLAYTGFMAVLYLGFPDLLMFGHAAGAGGVTSPEFLELRNTTIVLLRFVAAYCVLDTFYIIYLGAIKGAGDTRFILLATLLLAPLPVIASWAGIQYFGWGLNGCWISITAWVMINGFVYWMRYLQGKWRGMRVIEAELL